VAAAGLSDRVDIELCDYRDVDGRYDAVLSWR
jgi:cyclopropane-fatty-acyl-phospholipid synthase